jgi:hypothetical protein
LYSGERPKTQTLISDCKDQAGPRLASVTGVPKKHIVLTPQQAEELVAEFERFRSQGGKSDLDGGLLGRGAGSRRPGLGRMAKAKSIGWAIYVAGFVIWLFGYLSTGHAATFDWDVVAPSWISSFVPNLEAEFGLALMFASMIPIYWRAGRKRP